MINLGNGLHMTRKFIQQLTGKTMLKK